VPRRVDLIMAIDPGPEQSAYVVIDCGKRTVLDARTLPNGELLDYIPLADADRVYIEMIASYGMAVGKSVFETCVWVGRFMECAWRSSGQEPALIYRKDVKMHLCGNTKAKDANIRQAIMDLYGSTREKAIGTKKRPGPLYGVKGDEWAAIGVALAGISNVLQT